MKKTVFAVGFLALIVLALTFPFMSATAQKDN
jgi:hypothetical protein